MFYFILFLFERDPQVTCWGKSTVSYKRNSRKINTSFPSCLGGERARNVISLLNGASILVGSCLSTCGPYGFGPFVKIYKLAVGFCFRLRQFIEGPLGFDEL